MLLATTLPPNSPTLSKETTRCRASPRRGGLANQYCRRRHGGNHRPELIVLAGESSALSRRIRELVGRVIPWPMRIELSALGADAALMGAMGCARGHAHDLLCDLGRGQVQLPALR